MRVLAGAALTVLLAVIGPSLLIAADQPEPASGTAAGASDSSDVDPATGSPAGEASPAGETANPEPSQDATKPDDQGVSTTNVNRHRPGACPEGPPCKDGD